MEATDFKRASQAVWEAMAPGWDHRHAYFEERARPVAERMLEHLAPAGGDTIVELAAGTGVVGFAAAALVGSSGRVIVSDFSEAMVEAAQRHARKLGLANVECRVLDAERLDLPDGAAGGVLCRWGYMLMGDPGCCTGAGACPALSSPGPIRIPGRRCRRRSCASAATCRRRRPVLPGFSRSATPPA